MQYLTQFFFFPYLIHFLFLYFMSCHLYSHLQRLFTIFMRCYLQDSQIEKDFLWKSYRFSFLLIYLNTSMLPCFFPHLSPACHTSAFNNLFSVFSPFLCWRHTYFLTSFSPTLLSSLLPFFLCMFASFWCFLLLMLFSLGTQQFTLQSPCWSTRIPIVFIFLVCQLSVQTDPVQTPGLILWRGPVE